MEITTYVAFKICPTFYFVIGNTDFTEFSCIINLLILLLSSSHSLLDCILVLTYGSLGTGRDLLKFWHCYLESSAINDLYYYF